jgi:hypothetical protein
MDPVDKGDLVVAAQYFPMVRHLCPKCGGCGTMEIPHGEVQCNVCEPSAVDGFGTGYVLRDMHPREEHHYLMHLLRTKYVLR